MHIRYIGHASIAIDVAGKHLVCDPWWNGPAYTGQWYHYPLPKVEAVDTESVDFIYISHGHEDHLHVPTLRHMSKCASVVIPRFRDAGMRDFLRSLGFASIIEIGHGETRQLSPGLMATMYINKEDSILVLEGDGRTLVNGNDALHASSRHVIDHFCDQILARHPRVDTLLLGYGGASWFPNCIQITDDVSYDAAMREQVFAENFAYIARRLGARLALPFAASFVLLEDRLRWLNDVRFNMPSPCEELRRQGGFDVRTHFLMPGDRILDDQIQSAGGVRPAAESAAAEIDRAFAMPIAELRQRQELDEERMQRLLRALEANAAARAGRILSRGQRLLCRIDLRDLPEYSILVDCDPERSRITRCDRLRLVPMVLTTRLAVLEALATQDYGFESVSIGYGATLQLRRRDLALRQPLLAVLGRKPLPPTRLERLWAFLRAPWREFQVWRGDLHWNRLALRMRRGEVQRWNDVYSADPERWSALREKPIPARRSA